MPPLFDQLGRGIRETHRQSGLNTRRVHRNFPQVERKVDTIVFDHQFRMEFKAKVPDHKINMTLRIQPPGDCFQCNPGAPVYANQVECTTGGGVFGPADGNAYPVTYSSFSSNVGGFVLDPGGGVIVPTNGVYNVRFSASTGGVIVSSAAAILSSVRLNGILKAQTVYSTMNGKLTSAYVAIDMHGLCISTLAGDTLSAYTEVSGIDFFYGSGGSLYITKIAEL